MKPVHPDDLQDLVGKEAGLSGWRVVTQNMIDQFAEATDDHQFIHVDPERAKKETQFGGTIAHGFLSLSLLSTLAYEALPGLEGASMGINYGFDSVRFLAPVKTGSRVRARFVLDKAQVRPSGWVQLAYKVTLEIENSTKPAFLANWLTLSVIEQKEESA